MRFKFRQVVARLHPREERGPTNQIAVFKCHRGDRTIGGAELPYRWHLVASMKSAAPVRVSALERRAYAPATNNGEQVAVAGAS